MDTKRLTVLLKQQEEIQHQIESLESEVRSGLNELKHFMQGYNKQSDLVTTMSELGPILEKLGFVPLSKVDGRAPSRRKVSGKQRPRVIRPVREVLRQYNSQLSVKELLDLTKGYQTRNGMDRDTMLDEITRLVEEGKLVKNGDQIRLND